MPLAIAKLADGTYALSGIQEETLIRIAMSNIEFLCGAKADNVQAKVIMYLLALDIAITHPDGYTTYSETMKQRSPTLNEQMFQLPFLIRKALVSPDGGGQSASPSRGITPVPTPPAP